MKTRTRAKVSDVLGYICFGVAVVDAIMVYVSSKIEVLRPEFGVFMVSAVAMAAGAYANWMVAERLEAEADVEDKKNG